MPSSTAHPTTDSALLAFVCLPVLALLCACVGPTPPASAPPAVHRLSSDLLQVDVMDPNVPDRYYDGPRFSPVATVLGVRMAGHEFLFAPADHDPRVDGGGLAMEFDIGTEPNPPPPGFDEAAPGEGFIKVGVGVLRKEQYPLYKFYTPYTVLEPAVTTAEWRSDRVRFAQTCQGTAGYAYRLDAEVRVVSNEVRIRYRLTNTGTKPFSTEQYAHNFFSFDGHPVTPGAYEVEFPYDCTADILKPVIQQQGRKLMLIGEITPKVKAAQAFVRPPAHVKGNDVVTVRQPATGLQIKTTLSRPASSTTVHMGPLYLCPEQFLRVDLKPGETAEWTRTYAFHAPASS